MATSTNNINIVVNAKDNASGKLAKVQVNVRELGEKISNLGMRMTAAFTLPIVGIGALILRNEEVVKSLEPVRAAFSQVGDDLATAVLPVIKELTPALLSLADSLSKGVNWFSNLSTGQKETIIAVLGVIAALGPLVTIIGQVVGFVGTLQMVWATLAPMFSGLASGALPAIGTALAAVSLPVIALVAAVVGLGVTIAVFGKDAWETVKTIGQIFEAIWTLIKIKVQRIIDVFRNVNWAQVGANIMTGIRNGIVNAASTVINALQNVVKNAINKAMNLFKGGSSSGSGVAGNNGYPQLGYGFAGGGSFTVPSGFPNDSFPIRVQSGERVSITPAGKSSAQGGNTFVINYAPTVSTASLTELQSKLKPLIENVVRQKYGR